MKFWKDLFASDKKPPSLVHEVQKVYREPRVELQKQNVTFRIQFENNWFTCETKNLSLAGLGAELKNLPAKNIGDIVKGELGIDGQVFLIDLEIRFWREPRLGFRFHNPSFEFSKALRQAVRMDLVSAGMRAVDSRYLDQSNGSPLWIQDGKGNEIYILEKDGIPVRFNIQFSNLICGWIKGQQLQVGTVGMSSWQNPNPYEESNIVEWSKLDPKNQYLEALREMVVLVKDLKPETKAFLTQTLQA